MKTNQTRRMKKFWDSKAREDPQFYIATWRGYRNPDLDGFFLSSEEAMQYVIDARYSLAPGQRMLEIGCGMGRMTHGFAQIFDEVYGIDVSGEMVKLASTYLAKFSNVTVLETNGVDLQLFHDRMFHFVFSFIVFQHIPDKGVIQNYIIEAARVMDKDGVFHFQVNGTPDQDLHTNPGVLRLKRFYRKYIRKPILTAVRKVSDQPFGFEESEWTGSRYTKDEISLCCYTAGLDVVNITGENSPYMWVTARKH